MRFDGEHLSPTNSFAFKDRHRHTEPSHKNDAVVLYKKKLQVEQTDPNLTKFKIYSSSAIFP